MPIVWTTSMCKVQSTLPNTIVKRPSHHTEQNNIKHPQFQDPPQQFPVQFIIRLRSVFIHLQVLLLSEVIAYCLLHGFTFALLPHSR